MRRDLPGKLKNPDSIDLDLREKIAKTFHILIVDHNFSAQNQRSFPWF